jgi:hypothetical protein
MKWMSSIGSACVSRSRSPRDSAFEVFHDEVHQVGVFRHTEVRNADRIGMANLGSGLRLAPETLDGFFILAELGVQHLDGKRRPNLDVDGAIDLPHAAFTDFFLDAVLAVNEQRNETLAVHRAKGHIVFIFLPTCRTLFHCGLPGCLGVRHLCLKAVVRPGLIVGNPTPNVKPLCEPVFTRCLTN